MGRSRWIEALRFEEQLEKEALRRGKPVVMARPERLFPEIEKLPSWIRGSASFGGGVPTEALPSPAQRSALVWKNWFQQSTSVLRHGNNEALRSGEIRNGRRPGAVDVKALFFIFILAHANGARF